MEKNMAVAGVPNTAEKAAAIPQVTIVRRSL